MPLSRAPAATSASVIRSIQRGITTILSPYATQDIAVTAVDMAKSVLNMNGLTSNSSAAADIPRILLTSPTTITISRNGAGSNSTLSWELVEYN